MLIMPTSLTIMQRAQAAPTLSLQSLFSVYKHRGIIINAF